MAIWPGVKIRTIWGGAFNGTRASLTTIGMASFVDRQENVDQACPMSSPVQPEVARFMGSLQSGYQQPPCFVDTFVKLSACIPDRP